MVPRELAALLRMRLSDLPTASLKTARISAAPDAVLFPRTMRDFPSSSKRARSSFALKRTARIIDVLADGAVDAQYPSEPSYNLLKVKSWGRVDGGGDGGRGCGHRRGGVRGRRRHGVLQ